MDRIVREAAALGHRPGAPVRGVFGFALQRSGDDALDLRVAERARGSTARSIVQSAQALLHEARPPLADRLAGDAFGSGDRRVAQAFGRPCVIIANSATVTSQSDDVPVNFMIRTCLTPH